MSVWACGVCDLEMEEKTPAIVCIKCRNWVHLRKCAKLTPKEAKKRQKKFICSSCTAKNTKDTIKKIDVKRVRNLADFLDVPVDADTNAAETLNEEVQGNDIANDDAGGVSEETEEDVANDGAGNDNEEAHQVDVTDNDCCY